MPASAREAPINCRNPRRETESTHSDAPFGNSRCNISWNSGVPASSSRLRQYSGPLVWRIWASNAARERPTGEDARRSTSNFLLGQTACPELAEGSSRFVLCASSIMISGGSSSPPVFLQCLAMTRAAAGDVAYAAQFVLGDQRSAERDLVGITVAVEFQGKIGRGLLVAHVEYLVARTQVFFGSAMAVKTPLHLQRSVLVHHGHLVHRTMASVAAHALVDMNAVVEIHEVG